MSETFNFEEELHDLISKAVNEHDVEFEDIIQIFSEVITQLEEEVREGGE